jgi:hypothetical protein
MHPPLALASLNIFLDWRRHSQSFASQFLFKLPTRSIKIRIDAFEEFARAAQKKASNMGLPFLQVPLKLMSLYVILMKH